MIMFLDVGDMAHSREKYAVQLDEDWNIKDGYKYPKTQNWKIEKMIFWRRSEVLNYNLGKVLSRKIQQMRYVMLK